MRADGTTAYQDAACPVGAQSKTLIAITSKASPTVLMAPDSHGHFHARLSINDVEVEGLIDTGATKITLSTAIASAMHISRRGVKLGMTRTANGNVLTYNTIINMLKIGDIELYNVDVAVTDNAPTLIGMSALSRFKITQENGQMILEKR
jgi:aspartyl protease family protein